MTTAKKGYGAELLLTLTAVIWGFAFVAQRVGMDHVGPFAYNGVRFALGALSLLPLWLYLRRRPAAAPDAAAATMEAAADPAPAASKAASKTTAAPLGSLATLGGSALAGTVLFLAASLQQLGLVSTTAGNAGFITSLYVVIVPLLGLLAGRRVGARVWIGAGLALGGLYLISVGAGFVVAPGDLLELAGALFWAFHILIIARLAPRADALLLAMGQFAVCSALSLLAAAFTETTTLAGLRAALIPILYGGLLSIGVAYTLQIVAQRRAHPASASIILSMESLFAGLGGILLLGEPFGLRFGVGALLMLAGLVVSQLPERRKLPARQ